MIESILSAYSKNLIEHAFLNMTKIFIAFSEQLILK